MFFFDFESTPDNYEYYEILQTLMARWEHEIVEFKEAKGQYSEDKIGQYFSAISNEANLAGRQYGWFILGVSEQGDKHPTRNKQEHRRPPPAEHHQQDAGVEHGGGLP